MRVLLLEDEIDLSKSARDQLEHHGHVVFSATTVEAARTVLDNEADIEVLIADQEVPDGFGARFAIESKGRFPELKVVVVSGRLQIGDIEELEAHGIAYHNKPFLYAEMVERLNKA